jgi:hypothetical protein
MKYISGTIRPEYNQNYAYMIRHVLFMFVLLRDRLLQDRVLFCSADAGSSCLSNLLRYITPCTLTVTFAGKKVMHDVFEVSSGVHVAQ